MTKGIEKIIQTVKNSTENILENPLILLEDQINRIFIFNEYGLYGGIFSLFAVIIALHQIIMHLNYFNKPKFQLYIVRILLMVPVNKKKFIKDLFCSIMAVFDFSKIFGNFKYSKRLL